MSLPRQGVSDALNSLAYHYSLGIYVKKNPKKAMELYEESIK